MPKQYGIKEKDLVVEHVVALILTGKLRTGDRIDRNEIAKTLGLSRVPVQEAVVQLEHDGVVSTRYHRGAFVEPFDEHTVAEHHEVYGVLNGIAAARAAQDRDPAVAERLEALLAQLRTHSERRSFPALGRDFRAVINDQYAGPRLAALIRGSHNLMPQTFWQSYDHTQAELLPFYESETDAIRRGDTEAAQSANLERAARMGRIMVTELRRRGVLGDLRWTDPLGSA